ncbi:MAG: hypothetical protein ABSC56_13250 [Solirubrobacteraceae bacterium]
MPFGAAIALIPLVLGASTHHRHGAFIGLILLLIIIGVGGYFIGRRRRRRVEPPREDDSRWGR